MGRKSKVDVSVIVAHYNREDIISETLRSIQDQTFQNFECLIIDDFSTDGSPAVIKDLCEQDQRFIYSRNNKNSGKCASYNRGIKMARGRYIIFIDNDDIFDKNYIAELYSAIDETKSDMAVCNYDIWYCDAGEVIKPLLHHDSAGGGIKFRGDYIQKEWYLMLPPQVWTKIFRRDIIIDNDINFINVAREGNLFFHKYQFFSNKITVVDKELIKYRLFSDINKHSSGGDYYGRSDVLYEMVKFRNERIKNKDQRIAWDLYVAKFIHEIYSSRIKNYNEKTNIEVIKATQRELVDMVHFANISNEVKDMSEQIWSNLIDLRDGVTFIEHYHKSSTKRVLELTTELDTLRERGIKLAAKKLGGEIKRKLLNIIVNKA